MPNFQYPRKLLPCTAPLVVSLLSGSAPLLAGVGAKEVLATDVFDSIVSLLFSRALSRTLTSCERVCASSSLVSSERDQHFSNIEMTSSLPRVSSSPRPSWTAVSSPAGTDFGGGTALLFMNMIDLPIAHRVKQAMPLHFSAACNSKMRFLFLVIRDAFYHLSTALGNFSSTSLCASSRVPPISN